MGDKKQRKHLSGEEKISILRKHLLEKTPVSDLCEQHGVHPTQFYQWQKQLFENGANAFERRIGNRKPAAEQRMEYLESKIKKKDEVLAELMEEHIALKKSLGEI